VLLRPADGAAACEPPPPPPPPRTVPADGTEGCELPPPSTLPGLPAGGRDTEGGGGEGVGTGGSLTGGSDTEGVVMGGSGPLDGTVTDGTPTARLERGRTPKSGCRTSASKTAQRTDRVTREGQPPGPDPRRVSTAS
jgi:hypothetical protein